VPSAPKKRLSWPSFRNALGKYGIQVVFVGRKPNFEPPKPHSSRTSFGLCANDGCLNDRRHGSAFCQACSDRHNNRQ